jgi:predicted small secreted protein
LPYATPVKRALALLFVLACLGFVLAGCGTSNGPGGGGGNIGGAGTQGQDTNSQPSAGGLQNGAYTAGHVSCALYPLSQIAQQNGLPSNATAQQVAKKIGEGQSTKADQKSATRGCLDALNGK